MATAVKRAALLLCVLLMVLALTATPASSEQQATAFETIDVDDRLSAAVSGCGLCQRTGQCDQAFRGTPGQFCQTLVSAAPCCCPADAQCVLDNAYNCRCRRSVVSSRPNVRTVTHTTSSSSSSVLTTVFFLLLMICCVCCCCGAAEKRHRRHERECYAQPVYTATTTQYGTNDGYAYPSAPPMYEERSYAGGGGNSSGFGTGAVGAVAGLAAGAFLGSAFSGDGGGSHQQSSTTTSYFAGDSGGATSTFDFSGDTGGDDGGDFAGDS